MPLIIASNRRAYHRFQVLETLEAGIELLGPEIKSLRLGRVNLGHSYVKIIDGESFVVGMRIDPYPKAPPNAFDPERRRKLLLRQEEIKRLLGLDTRKGSALVPLKIYLRHGLAKLEIGVCQGKSLRDRREELKKEAMAREGEITMKERLRS